MEQIPRPSRVEYLLEKILEEVAVLNKRLAPEQANNEIIELEIKDLNVPK